MMAAKDAFGEELRSYRDRGEKTEIVERDDGYISASPNIPMYFAPFRDWADADREAIGFVRGRVLDVGCGAGRVARTLDRDRPGYFVVLEKRR